jgi:hypothetical protein
MSSCFVECHAAVQQDQSFKACNAATCLSRLLASAPHSFLHSYTYSVMQLHKLAKTQPFEVHMVFGYGHKESKVYKLRDAGLGYDPADSDYYNPPGGLMSFDLVPPQIPAGFSGWAVEDLSYTEVRARHELLLLLILGIVTQVMRTSARHSSIDAWRSSPTTVSL